MEFDDKHSATQERKSALKHAQASYPNSEREASSSDVHGLTSTGPTATILIESQLLVALSSQRKRSLCPSSSKNRSIIRDESQGGSGWLLMLLLVLDSLYMAGMAGLLWLIDGCGDAYHFGVGM